MKHIFLISLLGAFVSVSAMGVEFLPPEIEVKLDPFYDDLLPGNYLENENDCLAGKQQIRGTLCLPGYFCPGEMSIRVDLIELDIDAFCEINLSSFPYGLNKCPDGTTSDAGAKSIDDCYPIESPTPSRAPGRIDRNDTNPVCDDTTLGTTSGSTDFEADWTANTINITWVGNGATISGGATTCTYDQSFTLPTPPTKTGYTFDGWRVVNK